MSLRTAVLLSPLHLEDADLFIPPVTNDLGLDRRSGEYRVADRHLIAIADHQDLGKINMGSGLTGELFHSKIVSDT